MHVLITGASRGIGKAIALEFGKVGFNYLFLTYNKGQNEIADLQEDLEIMHNTAITLKLDVRDRHECKMMAFKLKEFNSDFHIDVLVNNAGVLHDKTFAKMTDEEWDDVLNTNLTGAYNVTKAFHSHISEGGSIINIGSVIGSTGNFGQCNYAASKAGLLAFTKSLAKEFAKRKIRVNMVSPSLVDTGMMQKLMPEQRDRLIERTALKRMATPEEIAKFIKFLATEGTYCTGQNYFIDGGYQ